MSEHLTVVAASLELALIFAGGVFLWQLVVRPAARRRWTDAPLKAWDITLPEFLTFLLSIMVGTLATLYLAGGLARYFALRGDHRMVLNGTAAQCGMLLGIFFHRTSLLRRRTSAPTLPSRTGILTSGGATFLVALPVLVATAKGWELFLEICGVPVQRQDLLRMFAHADSPGLLGSMILLAVVIAPATEELVFRAGLFRYFRTRIPRVAALLAPALIFASLHVENWETLEGFASFAPLTVLAVVFSLAYERTGRIGTPMVAHALFNLNTILLIFAGVEP
jgi:membrane protease YdiL (CAAX protease family)